MAFQFVLLDETQGATTTAGSKLTSAVLTQAAALLTVYLNRDVAQHYGIPGGAIVRAGATAADIRPGEWPFHLVADLPNAPSAIAYHTVAGAGVPDLYDGITLSDTLFGPGGWLSALAHELVETTADPAVNRLCADDAGKLWDEEPGDPVEVQSYAITLPDGTSGYVSNFVLPAWFIPGHIGPFDFMTAAGIANPSAPTAPFQVASGDGGNYAMWEVDPGSQQQVNAERVHGRYFVGSLARRAAKKASPASRAYRRGLRLPVPA